MLRIEINNKVVDIGSELPDEIYQASINWNRRVKMLIPKQKEKEIEEWYKDIVKRLTVDYISVNGVLTLSKDLKENL